MGRMKLLSKYEKPEEERLATLIADLMALPGEPINRAILKNALNGYYSNCSSPYEKPAEVLQLHLMQAAESDPSYRKLVKKARNDEYDHYKGARIKFDPHVFMSQFYPPGLATEPRPNPKPTFK